MITTRAPDGANKNFGIDETAFSMAVLENLNSYVCKLYPYCLYPISLCNPSLGQGIRPLSVHHENSSHSPPSAM